MTYTFQSSSQPNFLSFHVADEEIDWKRIIIFEKSQSAINNHDNNTCNDIANTSIILTVSLLLLSA